MARAAEPAAVKDELISVTAELLESLDGAMITGCDLNTSLEDMERLTALTPHVLAAVGTRWTPVPPPPTAPWAPWKLCWNKS